MDPPPNQLLPLNVPWDVIATIIKQTDSKTLKALSLVSRDFHTESAPILCRVFSVCVLPNSDSSAANDVAIARVHDLTTTLRTHSRLHYIRHVRLHLCASLGGHDDTNAKLYLAKLFGAFRRIKNIEVLELHILFHQHIVARCLNEIPLARGLKRIEIWSFGPIVASIKAEFWDRQREQLTSLTLLTPAPALEADTDISSKLCFPALERLHIYGSRLIRCFQLPLAKTLRSLAIDQIRLQDVEAFQAAISLHSKPSPSSQLLPSSRRVSYSASSIEEFTFGFSSLEPVPDPSIVYTAILQHMPRLRKLVARHDIFPCARTTIRASTALVRNNRDLEKFDLILPLWAVRDPTPLAGTETLRASLQTLEGDPFVAGHPEDHVVRGMSNVAKFASLAQACSQCESLSRLSFSYGEKAADGVNTPILIVLVRDGVSVPWEVCW